MIKEMEGCAKRHVPELIASGLAYVPLTQVESGKILARASSDALYRTVCYLPIDILGDHRGWPVHEWMVANSLDLEEKICAGWDTYLAAIPLALAVGFIYLGPKIRKWYEQSDYPEKLKEYSSKVCLK